MFSSFTSQRTDAPLEPARLPAEIETRKYKDAPEGSGDSSSDRGKPSAKLAEIEGHRRKNVPDGAEDSSSDNEEPAAKRDQENSAAAAAETAEQTAALEKEISATAAEFDIIKEENEKRASQIRDMRLEFTRLVEQAMQPEQFVSDEEFDTFADRMLLAANIEYNERVVAQTDKDMKSVISKLVGLLGRKKQTEPAKDTEYIFGWKKPKMLRTERGGVFVILADLVAAVNASRPDLDDTGSVDTSAYDRRYRDYMSAVRYKENSRDERSVYAIKVGIEQAAFALKRAKVYQSIPGNETLIARAEDVLRQAKESERDLFNNETEMLDNPDLTLEPFDDVVAKLEASQLAAEQSKAERHAARVQYTNASIALSSFVASLDNQQLDMVLEYESRNRRNALVNLQQTSLNDALGDYIRERFRERLSETAPGYEKFQQDHKLTLDIVKHANELLASSLDAFERESARSMTRTIIDADRVARKAAETDAIAIATRTSEIQNSGCNSTG